MMDEREFEQKLRTALRPVAAPAGLAERIVKQAQAREAARRRPVSWVRWGAIAALLTIGTFGGLKWNAARQTQQMEARRAAEQFTLAMHIATMKVSRVQRNLVVEVPLRPGGGQ